MVQYPRNLVEHHANVLGAHRHLHAEQSLDRQHISVLVAHHRHVIEPVHIGERLDERLVLGELLGGAMQKTDMRIGALDHFSIELEHEPQHAVGRRMLRPEVHRVVTDFGHYDPGSYATADATSSAARCSASAICGFAFSGRGWLKA